VDILEAIKEYGNYYYAIVFMWTFLEGETFVIFSGVAAREGILDLPTLIAFAWLGSFLGDQLYFLIGRRYGARLLLRFPRWKPGVDHALNLLKKYSTGFILSFRFIYGVRNFSSFAMGMSGLAWSRFALLNFIAAGVWAVCFAGAGYLAGMALQHILGDLATGFGLLMLAAFLIAIAVLFKMSRRRPVPPQPAVVPATVPNRNVQAQAE
jgi:membrane protein DedA with SNARE-associated domain